VTASPFATAERIADAVMYEGYVLYPYRASAIKNRLRWQFGVLAPREYTERAGTDSWYAQTECLIEAGQRPRLTVRVRSLQLERRTIEVPMDGDSGHWRASDRFAADGRELLPWDQGLPHDVIHEVSVDELSSGGRVFPLAAQQGREVELVYDGRGAQAARIVHDRWPASCLIRVTADPRGAMVKIRVRIENLTPWPTHADLDRELALRHSLIGCHTLLHVDDGDFVSLLDPPPYAVEAAASCRNEGTWPVLAGSDPSRDVMLSSPIILYDYPRIAPESAGDFFDATEVDELLELRVMTMTDAEKREAAATDDRARQIVDRAAGHSPDDVARLHGAIRSWETFLNPPDDAAPEDAVLQLGSVRVARGCRVRLRPQRRADSIDMFLVDRVATIAAVYRDLEGRAYVAVTLDDDPAADLRLAYGRFFYFGADEIVPAGDTADDIR
jgi:hypothetical protein